MVVTHGTRGRGGAPAALTVGNFDGVHRGHLALIERVVARARERALAPCLLTFEPHPREFFSPAAAPARLTRLRDKLEALAATGIARVHVQRFDAAFASLDAARFIEEVMIGALRARFVLVGRDFRFGAGRRGDFATLQGAAAGGAFELEAMPEVLVDGERVSSSAVRAALQAGDFGRAEALLGRPYAVSGHVAHGAKLGRDLGYPTANIVLPHIHPLAGIYAVEVEGLGRGVASVGRRPTVNPVERPLLEVHLFDWEGELYGRCLRVRFRRKLRDEAKFDGLPALREAIARDAEMAREFFSTHG